jgi:dihydrofolate reductase
MGIWKTRVESLVATTRRNTVTTRLRYSTSISLDGFVAGDSQSVEHPLGVGGGLLHAWMRELAVWRRDAGLTGGVVNASTEVYEAEDGGVGALLMGRNMFGGGPGPWPDDPWNGWWGDEPPFRLPVFVLTHHPREHLAMQGGTSFTFVTEGIEAALAQATHAAGGSDVAICGGASVAKQYLAAGLIDDVQLHLVPVLLGAGVRLFGDPAPPAGVLEQVRVVAAPGVAHLTYRRLG